MNKLCYLTTSKYLDDYIYIKNLFENLNTYSGYGNDVDYIGNEHHGIIYCMQRNSYDGFVSTKHIESLKNKYGETFVLELFESKLNFKHKYFNMHVLFDDMKNFTKVKDGYML